jgi:hypothetical protein
MGAIALVKAFVKACVMKLKGKPAKKKKVAGPADVHHHQVGVAGGPDDAWCIPRLVYISGHPPKML